MNLILWWIKKEAPWWMFWMPQSGFIGGFLFAMFIIAVCTWIEFPDWHE